MAHVISDECVSCGSCEGECPVGAISEGDGKYEIDADACVDCGACVLQVLSQQSNSIDRKVITSKNAVRVGRYFLLLDFQRFFDPGRSHMPVRFRGFAACENLCNILTNDWEGLFEVSMV